MSEKAFDALMSAPKGLKPESVGIAYIARVTHEVNRAYCNALGDASQPAWEDAPDWQKQSAINGVKFAMATPDATPEDMHNSWLREKTANGWTYGEKKDAVALTHPCMMMVIIEGIAHMSAHIGEDPETMLDRALLMGYNKDSLPRA